MIEIIEIAGSKFNSVRLSFPCFSCPLLIEAMRGGCATKIDDQCPFDSALAAAFLDLLSEYLLAIHQSKPSLYRISYYVQFGRIHVCISLPQQFMTVKYALKAIRKTVSHILTKRVTSTLNKARPEMKRDARIVHNTIAKSMNGNSTIQVFTNQKISKLYLDSIMKYELRILDAANDTLPRIQSMIGTEGDYRLMRGFDLCSNPVKAVLLATLSIANFDFYTDQNHKLLYIQKRHFIPTLLLMLRKFIEQKVSPFIKEKATIKDVLVIMSLVYNLSPANIVITKEQLLEPRFGKDMVLLLSDFVDRFPKTKSQQ